MKISQRHFSEIDSTNTWAKNNAHLLPPGKLTLITADTQTCGKGRLGRQWISPPKQNLYASFCFFIDKGRKDIGNISLLMAVSVSETLESLGFHPQIKWPNDILINGKKAGGILCELAELSGPSDQMCAIAGIGLNINMPLEQLNEIDQPATSLLQEGGGCD